MFILRWFGRLLRQVSVLKRYLLTLTWMIFVAVLYFALQVPVKIECQVKCIDENCSRLAHRGCPHSKGRLLEVDSSPPRHTRQQNFIEYLLFHSESGDREERPLFFPNEDRGHQEGLGLPMDITHRPIWTKAAARPGSQTNVVTDGIGIEISSVNEEPPPSFNNALGTVSMEHGTETRHLDNVTGDVWINSDASSEWIKNYTDAISLDLESGTTSQNNTGTATFSNSTDTKSLSDTGKISLNTSASRSTPLRSSDIKPISEKRVENQTDLLETAPKKRVSNASKAENTDSTKKGNATAQKQRKLGPTLVEKYFKDERKKCAKQDRAAHANANEDNIGENDHLHNNVSSSQKFCPCIPPNLVGRIAVNLSNDFSLDDLWGSEHRDIESGGEWQPPDCRSRTRLALIVPYRDRLDHLKTFLRHMLPILKRQLTHFRIFIVEQNEPAVFNKAAMMNIGYLEAVKQFNFDCVMFHDVDILMEDDRSLLNCGDQPHHYAISLDRWNYHLKYEAVFGAVISLRPQMFNRTNGFSNSYFGWGAEDDDMSQRVRRFWKVYRPPMEVGRYITLKHTRDAANAVNKDRMRILRKQRTAFARDGINSIRYKVETSQKRPLFTWILANLDVSHLPYPSHVSFQYTLSQRVCIDERAMTAPRHLSRVTCQYDCDRQRASCVGYNHRIDGDKRICRMLTRICSSFGDVTHQQTSSQTYLKVVPV